MFADPLSCETTSQLKTLPLHECILLYIFFFFVHHLGVEEFAVFGVSSFLATANDFQLNLDLAILEIPPVNPVDRCFTIDITDDSEIEGTEQFTISFEVDFADPDASIENRITSDPAEATIFIQDNDGNK